MDKTPSWQEGDEKMRSAAENFCRISKMFYKDDMYCFDGSF